MTWQSPIPFPRAGTPVCGAVSQGVRCRTSPCRGFMDNPGWPRAHRLPRTLWFSLLLLLCPLSLDSYLSHYHGFFLWLDWHYFLRAWSLNVFHSFIFGKFFFVLQRECNQIYYLILSGTYIFLTMLFSISFEAHWLRTGYCLLPVSQSLGQHEGSALCVWSCVWGGSKLSFLSLAWKEGGLGQHAQKLTSGPIWLTYVLYFLVTPSWLPVFVIILTRVQCFWYFTSSEDFLRKVFLYLNLTWKGL